MADERSLSVLGNPEDWIDPSDTVHRQREAATRRRERRMLTWLVAVVLLLALGLYAAGWALTSDRLPRGTTVAGVDVGGLRPAEAESALSAGLVDRSAAAITVVVGDREFTVDPREAGLDVDVPASVAQVPVGRSGNPADMWENVVGGSSYDPVVVTIDDMLSSRLTAIAEQVDSPAQEGTVRFTAEGAEPVYASSGESLDVTAASEAVAAAYVAGKEVDLTLDPVVPVVSSTAVSRAMSRFANPATSAPVVYRFGSRDVVVRPSDLPGMLTMQADGRRLVPHLDEDAFARLVGPQVAAIERPARDARIVGPEGRMRVVPAVDGRAVDVGAMADLFLTLAVADGEGRRVLMQTREVPPALSTAAAQRRLERLDDQSSGRDDRN